MDHPTAPPIAEAKTALEVEKLKLEIDGLKRWWRQPGFSQAGIALLAAVISGLLTFAALYWANTFQVSNQLKLQRHHEQRAVFARIMGRKFITKQLNMSRAEAYAYSDYHEARWKRAGAPKESIDLEEARRWMHRSEDLVFEIMKNNQLLFEDLATVRALFPDTKNLRILLEKLYNFKTIVQVSPPPRDASIEQLEGWKAEAVRQIQSLVEGEYGTPYESLISYLGENLPRD